MQRQREGEGVSGKFYLTPRKALIDGITEIDIAHISDRDPTKLFITKGYAFMTKPNWHETREEALKRIHQMRDERIADLKRQIKILEEKVF